MGSEELRENANMAEQATADQFTGDTGPDEAQAWEQVAEGRFMPRRVRGSYRGRALG